MTAVYTLQLQGVELPILEPPPLWDEGYFTRVICHTCFGGRNGQETFCMCGMFTAEVGMLDLPGCVPERVDIQVEALGSPLITSIRPVSLSPMRFRSSLIQSQTQNYTQALGCDEGKSVLEKKLNSCSSWDWCAIFRNNFPIHFSI